MRKPKSQQNPCFKKKKHSALNRQVLNNNSEISTKFGIAKYHFQIGQIVFENKLKKPNCKIPFHTYSIVRYVSFPLVCLKNVISTLPVHSSVTVFKHLLKQFSRPTLQVLWLSSIFFPFFFRLFEVVNHVGIIFVPVVNILSLSHCWWPQSICDQYCSAFQVNLSCV